MNVIKIRKRELNRHSHMAYNLYSALFFSSKHFIGRMDVNGKCFPALCHIAAIWKLQLFKIEKCLMSNVDIWRQLILVKRIILLNVFGEIIMTHIAYKWNPAIKTKRKGNICVFFERLRHMRMETNIVTYIFQRLYESTSNVWMSQSLSMDETHWLWQIH